MIGIYCFANKINNKRYIGQSVEIERRYKSHETEHTNINSSAYNTKFYRALRKYGFNNFEFSILEETERSLLNEREKYYIHYYNTYSNGYNMTLGGDCFDIFSNPEIYNKTAGENHVWSTISNEEAYQIRELRLQGINRLKAYEQFKSKASLDVFLNIWYGQTYKHIHMDIYDKLSISSKKRNKLTDDDVFEIRFLFMNSISIKEIYEKYKELITERTLRRVLNLESWKDSKCIPEGFIPRQMNRGNLSSLEKELGVSLEEKNYGKLSSKAKLNISEIKQIKFLLSEGISANKISKFYNISPDAIRFIKIEKTWKHVSFDPIMDSNEVSIAKNKIKEGR